MNADALDTFQLEMGTTSEVGMAIVLAVMMFSVALGLKTSSFKFFRTEPKLYLAGVTAQIIGLPLLTILLCFVLNPHPSIALGMILIACCPGGNTSIYFIVIAHNLLAFALGYITASVIRADKASKRALTIEVGIQNSGLGIVILLTQLGGVGGAGAVAGLWGVWHLIGGSGLAIFWRWKDARSNH